MPSLELTLLGGFRARFGSGDELMPRSKKAALLLARLALRAGEVHTRETLIGLLWSDRAEAQARASLRQELTVLRKMMGTSSVLAVDGERLSLDATAVEVDVRAFEALAKSEATRDLERAASLYRGPLLEGFAIRDAACEEWLTLERQRLRDIFLGVLDRLLARQVEEGAIHRAITTAQALLTHDPLREDAHRTLMLLHAQQGRRSLALKQFQSFCELLRAELGVEPEPETVRLHAEILAGRAVATRPAAIRAMPLGNGARSTQEAPPPAAAAPPFAAHASDAYQFYQMGRSFFLRNVWGKGALEAARRLFEQAIEIDPNYARAYAGLADCDCYRLLLGVPNASLDAIAANAARALQLDPDLAEAHATKGLMLYALGNHEDANVAFEQAVRLGPDLFEAHYFYARNCRAQGMHEKAAALFERSAAINQNDFRALGLLVDEYRALGRLEESLATARRCLERIHLEVAAQPDDAYTLAFGSNILAELGEREPAEQWAARANRIDPDDAIVNYNLACTYAALGQLEAALARLQATFAAVPINRRVFLEWMQHDTAIDPLRGHPGFVALVERLEADNSASNPPAHQYYLIGRSYFLQSVWGQRALSVARQMFAKAVEIDPHHARAYAGIANCDSTLLCMGDPDVSFEEILANSARALELDPGLPEAHAAKGLALYMAGRHGDANAALDEAVRLGPDLFEAHFFAGRNCRAQGRHAEAARLFERAAELQPHDFRALGLAVNAYRALGRRDDMMSAARRCLERTEAEIAVHPENAGALAFGAAMLAELGETGRAEEWVAKAARLGPLDSITGYNLACAYIGLGRFDAALARLQQIFSDPRANWRSHIEWMKHDSSFDPLRDHPGYLALLERLEAEGNVDPVAREVGSRPAIAVLPFDNLTGDPEQQYFADGIVEEITAALSRVRSFFVIARSSTLRYRDRPVDVSQVGRELGVRYLLQGSVRTSGGRLRITVQLIDAGTGASIWSDRYDGRREDVFDLEDRLTARIVGAIEPTIRSAEIERARRKRPDNLEAYDYVMRALPHVWALTPEASAEALRLTTEAVRLDPDYARANALAAWCHGWQVGNGWSASPQDSRAEGLRLARAALRLDADDPGVLTMVGATEMLLAGDLDAAAVHIGKALALDPNSAWAWIRSGYLHVYLGDAETALEHFERAAQLSPFDPLTFNRYIGIAFAHFVAARYQEAVAWAERARVERPGLPWTYRVLAAAYAQLGRFDAAREAGQTALNQCPHLSVPEILATAPFRPADVRRRFVDGLLAAGIPGAAATGGPAGRHASEPMPTTGAGECRPAVAVLPLADLAGDQEYFADGLTEDLITALTLWRSFPVIARNSTFVYKRQTVDIKQVARELGAGYVIEGSVRKLGRHVRVAVQLIDGATGHHVWAGKYDHELEDIFAFQDELTQQLAAVIAPELENAECKRSGTKRPSSLGAWDCYLRGMALLTQFTAQGNADARAMFEQAIALDPGYAGAYTGLAVSHNRDLLLQCAVDRESSLRSAMDAARRAVALDPSSAAAHSALGTVHIWRDENDLALAEARLAFELNPNDALNLHSLGNKSDLAGDPQGIELMVRAQRLNPLDPDHHSHLCFLARAYVNARRYDDAIACARAALLRKPDYPHAHFIVAIALAHLGRTDQARAALARCNELHPGFVASRADWRPYMAPASNAHLHEGLRKAGIPETVAAAKDAADRVPAIAGGPPENLTGETAQQSFADGEVGGRLAEGARKAETPDVGEKPAVAVLPFVNLSGDPDQQYFSDGITEDIITELSRWRQLKVMSRNSTFRYRDSAVDVTQVRRDLGVDYVVEGSIRRVGDRIRVTAQLIDAETGSHVWAERYDRDLEELFAVQGEVVQTIVGTLVGRVQAAGAERAKRKPPSNLAAYDCVLRGLALPWGDPQADAEARRLYERAIELDLDYGLAHALLALMIYAEWGTDPSCPDAALDRAFELATRAVELDEDESTCQIALGFIHLMRRSFDLAEQYHRRAVEMNPTNPQHLADMGSLLVYLGRPEEGLEWLDQARRVDPYFGPSWYWHHVGVAQMSARRYDEAIQAFERSTTMPYWVRAYIGACHAQAGRTTQAREWAAQALRLRPDFSARWNALKEPFKHRSDADHLIEALRKAGIPEFAAAPAAAGDDRRSVAVLPFANLGGNPAEQYFSDGITDDIITELSRFHQLIVVARHSSFQYREGASDVDRIGRELQVGYLVEGSIRRVGDRIRITVQLIETATGRHLWAERYDRSLDGLFDLQDEVARMIASALAVRIEAEDLVRAKRKPPESMGAYDYWLRGKKCLDLWTPEANAEARRLFAKAIESDPEYARGYAGLAFTHEWAAYYTAWDPGGDSSHESARVHAERAVALDDSDHLPHVILGWVHHQRCEFEQAQQQFDRAIAINPNDADAIMHRAMVLALERRTDEAIDSAEFAIRLNPRHPDWYLAFLGACFFRARRYGEAAAAWDRAPDAIPEVRACLAAACVLTGRPQDARRHMAEFLRCFSQHWTGQPGVRAFVGTEFAFEAAGDVERFAAALREAGMPE